MRIKPCLAITFATCWIAGLAERTDGRESIPVALQRPIAAAERMPRLPEPLHVPDWARVSQACHDFVLNPETRVDGRPLAIIEDGAQGFRMPSYMAGEAGDEAMTCLAAVIGAKLSDLDPQKLNGVDWVQAAKSWYQPDMGIYRHHRGDKSPVVHSGIYGYWPAILGMILAAQHPEDPELRQHLRTSVAAFLEIARGMGCPDRPDFNVLGYNFQTRRPDGRNEPMNLLGHAPSVAWPLVAGASLTKTPDPALVPCAAAALRWHIAHPGRYEISHLMGPLAAARLNALHDTDLDLDSLLAIWFGDGPRDRHPWQITAGTRFGGMTCDGLDGSKWEEQDRSFHAFAMGTLQGPAWLVPVVRYDPRYARAIARYALHAANSSRFFLGIDLDWDRQDHKDWKDRWDPQGLLMYEALTPWDWSPERRFRPYATGDPIRCGWGCEKVEPNVYSASKREWFSRSANNIALYGGNHIGFLGGICELTNVPGILRWDCLATDWLHPPAYPTFLYHNPYDTPRTVKVTLERPAHLYDLTEGRCIARSARSGHPLTLAADQAAVLVAVPPEGETQRDGSRLLVDGVVVDYRCSREK